MVTPQSVQGHTGLTHHFFNFWQTSMVLNDLVDSFCYSQKNAGLKGLNKNWFDNCQQI